MPRNHHKVLLIKRPRGTDALLHERVQYSGSNEEAFLEGNESEQHMVKHTRWEGGLPLGRTIVPRDYRFFPSEADGEVKLEVHGEIPDEEVGEDLKNAAHRLMYLSGYRPHPGKGATTNNGTLHLHYIRK